MRRLNNRTNMVFGLLIVIAIAVSGCGAPASPDAAPAAAAPAAQSEAAPLNLPLTIDAKTVNGLRGNPDVVFIDVREDNEYAAGHIPEATLIPLGQLSSRLSEIPKDKTVVAVCRSGNRSGQATQLLRQAGFDAHNMDGGMISWEQAGFDIQR
ncbi:MAG TPA: rhodanese-like domain-containing protein [Anaerolineae bacterium]|nr:rhodanese-like domain-containing protein [Anaerolineae bacterium]